MSSLAEQISQLANPAPVFLDPEDDFDEVTKAQLSGRTSGEDVLSRDSPASSSLRAKAAPLLSDTDQRYAGKRTTRQKLTESDDHSNDVESENEDSDGVSDASSLEEKDQSEDDDSNEEDLKSFKSKFQLLDREKVSGHTSISFDDDDASDLVEEYSDDEESEAESSDEEDEEEEDGDEDDEEDDEHDIGISSWMEQLKADTTNEKQPAEKGDVANFSKTSVDEEIQKGKAAQAQLGLWDSLLEGRIKLQRSVMMVNQLPQPDTWRTFCEQGGEEYRKILTEGQSSLKKLLDVLVQLQSVLLMAQPETKHLVQEKNKNKKSEEASDEEVTSESETETEETDQPKTSRALNLKRKIKMADYPEFLAKRHKDFQTYRNSTIQKWYDKTRVAAGKLTSKSFSAFDQSALKQIEQILSDKDRLVKRTQLKRSAYQVIGKLEKHKVENLPEQSEDQATESLSLLSRDHLKDYDDEIFDDDDFYHQLLRELIERKSSDITDPVAITKQWLEYQKLRSKTKKNVDRKASKGRKIRYDVHPKLVNFMGPINTSLWTDEQRDDLYSSLFGKRGGNPSEMASQGQS